MYIITADEVARQIERLLATELGREELQRWARELDDAIERRAARCESALVAEALEDLLQVDMQDPNDIWQRVREPDYLISDDYLRLLVKKLKKSG